MRDTIQFIAQLFLLPFLAIGFLVGLLWHPFMCGMEDARDFLEEDFE